jgi:hypothetical protein
LKDEKYMSIIDKYNLKKTSERISDFRSTMREIVGIKNGLILMDSIANMTMNSK